MLRPGLRPAAESGLRRQAVNSLVDADKQVQCLCLPHALIVVLAEYGYGLIGPSKRQVFLAFGEVEFRQAEQGSPVDQPVTRSPG